MDAKQLEDTLRSSNLLYKRGWDKGYATGKRGQLNKSVVYVYLARLKAKGLIEECKSHKWTICYRTSALGEKIVIAAGMVS